MFEIGLFICGDVNVRHGDKLYSPVSGDVHFYCPGEPHCGIILRPCLVSRVNFYVPETAFDKMGFDPAAFCRDAAKNGQPHILRMPQRQLTEFTKLVYETRTLLENNVYDADVLTYCNFLRLFVILNESYFEGGAAQYPALLPGAVSDACRCIDERFAEISSLTEVAESAHLNYSYLSAQFSRCMNMTMNEYLNLRRLSYSRYLLASGKNVTEACFDSGFSSLSYYIRLFRRCYSVTPGKYSEQLKAKSD